MAEKVLMRDEVAEELTWDLSLIYKTEEEFWADVEKLQNLAASMEENYKGQLGNSENICHCLEYLQEIRRIEDWTGLYAELAVSVDYYNGHNLELSDKLDGILSEVSSKLSFIDSEIALQDEAVIEEAIEQTKVGKNLLRDYLRKKPHLLHPEAESVLQSYSQILSSPYQLYETTKLADMKFDSFTVDGKEYPLSYSLFEDNYEYEKDTKVRRAAFEAFSRKIAQYENATAVAYNTTCQKEKITAQLRGFESVFDYLLFDQHVTREMYDRQIDLIMERLAPHMRKYAKILQKVHGLEKMTFADLKISVDPEYDPSVTIEGAHKFVRDGLSVLGEDYVKMVDDAFEERWIDFAKNQGKSTGGFCASPFQRKSFILLSYNNQMADVFTLAHELGHAGHFRLCQEAQSILDTDVSCYFVESPSTTNELIMAHYLLGTRPSGADASAEDKRFRRWVLSCIIGNTYYHNFVTHLLEAAYQREVYKIIDAGGSVHAETLSEIFKNTLEKFWGDAVEINEGAELTWMRQPHYYMGLYSYTYSAGLTIGTEVSRRIVREGQPAVDAWKKVLAAGSTEDPVGLAKMAGVDITTDKPLKDAIDYIGSIIDEIGELTEEL